MPFGEYWGVEMTAKPGCLLTASEMQGIVAAYVQDRSEQYSNECCCRVALEDVAAAIRNGEPHAAYAHGELDDLLKRRKYHVCKA